VSRISRLFSLAREQRRKVLIAYIVAGDPLPELTPDFMQALVAGGADLIELGIPFSDPEAEGPDIQAACERALAHRTCLPDIFEMVHVFRKRLPDVPVVLMGYLNSIENMGAETFAEEAAKVGVDGIIIVNMPPEEGIGLQRVLAQRELDTIYLVAPNTPDSRVVSIARNSGGFVYCVSLQGITGASGLEVLQVQSRMRHLRGLTTVPLAAGFGIRDANTAREVAKEADAIVIGSELVRRMAALDRNPDAIPGMLQRFMHQLRKGIDQTDR